MARKYGALILALEHRYYGESYPVPDMTTPNLAYLTSEQALSDLARFRNYIASAGLTDTRSSPTLNLKAPADGPWVVFGGSYPGNLAAWFKLKYPSLAAGAISSSAPLHAEYDFQQYAEVVGTALAYSKIGGSDACYSAVNKAVDRVQELISLGRLSELPTGLRPCGKLSSREDLATYQGELFGNFQGVVQYNLEGRPPTVAQVCKIMVNGTDPLVQFAQATQLIVGQQGGQKCVSSSFQKDTVDFLSNATFSGYGCDRQCTSFRQWIYQSCNEFGYFQTTTGTDHPFTAFSALDVNVAGEQLCEAVYNLSKYGGPNTEFANMNYGSRDLSGANITLSNGNMDPWHALGIVNRTDRFYESCS
eukprot:gene5953-7157_t